MKPPAAPRRPWSLRGAWVLTAAVLAGCLALTGTGVYLLHRSIQAAAQTRFNRLVERVERDIQRRFQQPVHGLNGLKSLYAANAALTRAAFHDYVEARDLGEEFPGVRGFGFSERVARSALGRFIAAERAEQSPDFDVRTWGEHPDLYVIKFIEPFAANHAAWGFDLGAEPVRRAAIERAVHEGRPTLTARIALVQDRSQGAGFLYLVPVFRKGRDPATPEQRAAALLGVVVAPIVVRELMDGVADVAERQLDFELFDGEAGEVENLVHVLQAAREGGERGAARLFEVTHPLVIGGRTLTLKARSTPAFDAGIDRSMPALLGVAGLLLSVLLALTVWLMAVGRARAQALAQEMTADLRRLAKVVQHTSNAVVITDAASRITWVNEGFERISGWRREEALGRVPDELLHSSRRPDRAERQRLRQALDEGTPCRAELLNRARDGREYWIDIEIQPLRDEGGALTGFMAIESDVTAQKLAQTRLEAALRETDALLRTINLHAIVSVADRDGRIIDANEAFSRISGYRRAELIGQDHRIVNSGLQPPEFWRRMWRTIAAGQPWRGEICNRAKDGSLYWVDSIIAPFVGPDGRIEKYVSIRTDITASKAAQQRLADLSDRLQLAIEGSSDGLWDWRDVRSDEVWWSPTFYGLLGHAPGGIPAGARTFRALLHPGHRRRVLRAMRRALAGGAPFDAEALLRTRAGDYRWFRARAKVSFDAAGRPLRMAGSLQDIHERKRAQAALAQTTALLRSVLDAASDVSVIATGLDRVVTVFNRGAERLLGWRADEIVGRATAESFHDPAELAARCAVLSAALGRPVQAATLLAEEAALGRPREWQYLRRDGGRVSVSLVVTALRTDAGETAGYLCLAHDITQRKEHEASLQEARRHAEQASVAKSQFLANMSHEIRTPLNAIIGMTDLALEGRLDADQRELMTVVRDSGQSLLALINDLLDFSKIEAGHMSFERIGFDLHETVAATVRTLAERAREKGLALEWVIARDVPRRVLGDPHRLRQVLLNLLSNALKFTAQGGVTLTLSRRGADEEGGDGAAQGDTLHFRVRDTGIGIAADQLEAVFEPFTQADASTTRRFGGTGLGLAICRSLVGLMDGRMWVESEPGRGSTFHFTARLAAEPMAEAGDAEEADGPRVLVLDAAPESDAELLGCLRRWGLQPVLVRSLAEAVRLAEGQRAHRPFQSVLAKASSLPAGDDAGVRLLCDPAAHDRLTVLLEDGRAADAHRSSFGACVPWPAAPSLLFDALTQAEGFAHSSLGRLDAVAVPAGAAPANCRILLAEDNPINQRLAIRLLQGMGHEVALAQDGIEAVERAGAEAFDLILMDVQMPRLGGLEATAAIRAQERPLNRHTPIVAMTAHAMAGDRERCLAAGMDGYLSKPIAKAALQHAVREHALRRRAETVSVAPAGAGAGEPATVPAVREGAAADAPLYDRGEALALLGGDVGLFEEVVAMYVGSLQEQLDALHAALRSGELTRLGAQAHALKGTAAMLAAAPARDTAARLEAACAAGQGPQARAFADELGARLRELAEGVEAELRTGPGSRS